MNSGPSQMVPMQALADAMNKGGGGKPDAPPPPPMYSPTGGKPKQKSPVASFLGVNALPLANPAQGNTLLGQ